MKKIFVAISISEKLQQGILEWEKDFQNLPVNWLNSKYLHVTLVPPWTESNIEKAKEKLDSIKGKIKPFDVDFKRVNFGPNHREPRLIWAENIPPKPAIELKDLLEGVFGYKMEYKRWTMHITLARFRPETFSSFPVKKLDEVIWWPERVDSIVLMEYIGNSEYKILWKTEFRG